MSAIEASLRLEIAQYQQQLARATGAVQKFKEDARANSKDMGRAIMGPPDSWALSASHRSALRSSLTGAGQEGGGMLGTGIMSGMGRVAGPTALAAGLILGLKKAGEIASANAVMQIKTEVLIGNKEGASKLIADLKELGARTPLEFPDLQEAGNMLVAFGEAADAVPATLRRIGDVSTGVGARIGEIAEIYGKARVAGTLFAEDINQLTGRGIPVIQEFARILGVQESEIKKLGSEGKLTFPLLEAAFINLTKEGGKFGGMMEKMAQTSAGKWSTVKDDVSAIAGEFGKPIDVVKSWGLDKVMAITGGIKSALTTNFFMPDKPAETAKPAESTDDKEAAVRAAFEAQAAEKAAVEAAEEVTKAAAEKLKHDERIRTLQGQITELEIDRLDPAERMVRLTELQRQKIDEMRNAGGLFYDATVQGMAAFAAAQAKNGSAGAEETLRRYQEVLRIQQQITGLNTGLRTDAAAASEADAKAKAAETEAWWEKMISEEKERQAQADARTSISEEIALLQAKATGQTQLVEAMERELAIRQRTQEIMSRTGMGQDEARATAARIEGLRSQADARANAGIPTAPETAADEGRKKIMGFSRERQGGVYERQDHLYNDPRTARAAADPAQQPLGPQAAKNAANAQPSQPSDPNAQLGQQILQIMQKMLPAMQ